jgi:hypothetical protein
MAKVSISEAARLAGKDRKTVQRHINSGKLSKEYDAANNPLIDISELERFYGKLKVTQEMPQRQNGAVSQIDAPQDAGNQAHEVELLKLKLQHAEQMQQKAEEETRREREAREKAEAEKERLLHIVESTTRLLEAPKEPKPQGEPETEKRNWWQRLTGG